MKLNKNSTILITYIVVSIFLRFFSFFPSVLDHDESTYMIIGRDIFNGKMLYTDVTDSKPIGIFLIYAFFQFIFGNSIILKRLAVSIIVGLSAYFVYKVSWKFFLNQRAALASGFIYILYISTWSYFGLSPNTEVFFNLFTIAGLLFFLRKGNLWFFIGGLMFGLGFIIKYLVLLDYVAIASFFLVLEYINSGKKFSLKLFVPYFLSGIAFSLPFILVNIYFYLQSNFSDFYFITYELPGKYNENTTLWVYVKMLLDFTGRFLPFSIIFFYVMFSRTNLLSNWVKPFIVVWLLGVLIAIYLPGKGFIHYTIQLMLPVSIISGIFFHPELKPTKFSKLIFEKKAGLLFLILFIVAIQIASIKANFLARDYCQEVADYLKKDLAENDLVYSSNYGQIVYYLLEKDAPTSYIHPSILSTDLYKAFNIDNKKELNRIIKSNPKYILIQTKFALLEQLIKKDYQVVKTFPEGRIHIYKRKTEK